MLRVARCIKGFGFEELSMHAFDAAKQKMRKLQGKVEVIEQITAFLDKRVQSNDMIIAKLTRYLRTKPEKGLPWTEEALVRLQNIPSFVLEMAKQAIEEEAKRRKEKVVTPEVVEQTTRTILQAHFNGDATAEEMVTDQVRRVVASPDGMIIRWTAEAAKRLRRIPVAYVRRMITRRVEEQARKLGRETVDLEAYEAGRGSHSMLIAPTNRDDQLIEHPGEA